MLKACLNGPRLPHEHWKLPVTLEQLAQSAQESVAAGAEALHVHAKDRRGHDTLAPDVVDATVTALREAVPDVPIGLTTGAWTSDDPLDREQQVAQWSVLPDFVSVNWHEVRSVPLAEQLLERGVGIEPGLWTPKAVAQWQDWPHRDQCVRVLLEIVADLPAAAALAAAQGLIDAIGEDPGVPVLLHGEERAAWPVLELAIKRGYDVRIGLEDTLEMPDGTRAFDNAALVRTVKDMLSPA